MCHQDLAQVTQRYVMLKGRVSGLAGEAGGALQRVTRLTAEARDLLDKASSSKKKLEGAGGACAGGHSPPSRPCFVPTSPGMTPLGVLPLLPRE